MLREVVRNVLLVLGGAVIIASLVYTATHFNDRVVVTVLVPGVVLGLLFVGAYVATGRGGRPGWPG